MLIGLALSLCAGFRAQAAATDVPANTSAPVVSGIQTVGQTLSLSNGGWDQPATSYVRKWQISDDGEGDWADIEGATGASYVLQAGDATKHLRGGVRASNSFGDATDYAYSDPVGPIAAALAVTGSPPTTATVGSSYSFTPTVSGGHGPYVRDLINGVSWLAFTGATGQVTGTPSSGDVGTVSGMAMKVTDADGLTATFGYPDITVSEAPAEVFATVGPHQDWDGTPGSGASADWADENGVPNNPERVHAKPVAHWWNPSQMRAVGDHLIGVVADAKGGIASVTFGGDIPDTVVSEVVYYTDTDINGNERTRPFWGIKSDGAAAFAVSETGAQRIYARVKANDDEMQERVIGPLTIYPRTDEYDWDVTVSREDPEADYATLKAAMAALKTALTSGGKECGRVTITSNLGDYSGGRHEWGYPDDTNQPWSKGHSCVTVAEGVTAHIVRGATFDSERLGTVRGNNDPWAMWSYVNNIEFRGAGLIIDRRHINRMFTSASSNIAENKNPEDGSQMRTGSFFFNGCRVTNSEGKNQTYWNGVDPYPFRIEESNVQYPCVVRGDGCEVTYLAQGAAWFDGNPGSAAIFSRVRHCYSVMHQGARFVFGEYLTDCLLEDEDFFKGPYEAATVQYLGSKAYAQITYEQPAVDNEHLYFQVSDDGVDWDDVHDFKVINPARYIGDGSTEFHSWAQISAWLDANAPGDWSISLTETPFAPYWVHFGGNEWPLDPKSAEVSLYVGSNPHSEWAMWNDGPHKNVLFQNNTCRNSGFSTTYLNGGNFEDASIKHNSADSNSGLATVAQHNGSSPYGSHVVWENNTLWDKFDIKAANTYDEYCSISQNVMGQIQVEEGVTFVLTNNVGGGGTEFPATGGNVDISSGGGTQGWVDYDTEWTSLFVDRAGGDFTPASDGALADHLFTSINRHDAQMAQTAETDAAGAWKLGGAVRTWPTITTESVPFLNGEPDTSIGTGEAWSLTLDAFGGVKPYTFSILDGPEWMSIPDDSVGYVDGGTLGEEDEGTYSGVSFRVTDANGKTSTIGPYTFSVTAPIVYDYTTFDPAWAADGGLALYGGDNLSVYSPSGPRTMLSAIPLPSTGKFQFEATRNVGGITGFIVGIAKDSISHNGSTAWLGSSDNAGVGLTTSGYFYGFGSNRGAALGGATIEEGEGAALAIDMDAGTFRVKKIGSGSWSAPFSFTSGAVDLSGVTLYFAVSLDNTDATGEGYTARFDPDTFLEPLLAGYEGLGTVVP